MMLKGFPKAEAALVLMLEARLCYSNLDVAIFMLKDQFIQSEIPVQPYFLRQYLGLGMYIEVFGAFKHILGFHVFVLNLK